MAERSAEDIAHLGFDHSNTTADSAYIGDGTTGISGVSSKMIYLHIAVAYRWFLFWGCTDTQDNNLHINAFREAGFAPHNDRLVRASAGDSAAVPTVSQPQVAEASRLLTLQDLENVVRALVPSGNPQPSSATLSELLPARVTPPPDPLSYQRAQNLLAGHLGQPLARLVSPEQADLILTVTNPSLDRDVLVSMRPGGGKTLAFEIAGRLRGIKTILFMAPLKSIAIDLIARTKMANVCSSYWSPTCRPAGGILFIALDQCGSQELHYWIKHHQTDLHCIVLDEIHGAAVDGYRQESWAHIDRLRHLTDDPHHRVIPLIGLSGSLTPSITSFTLAHFGFKNPTVISGPLNIPHLEYSFCPVALDPTGLVTHEDFFISRLLFRLAKQEKQRLTAAYLGMENAPTRQTLVLFPQIRQVDQAFERFVAEDDPSVGRYHSDVPPKEQEETLSAVRSGSCTLLLATSGAATGLDAAFTQVRQLSFSLPCSQNIPPDF